MVAVMATSTTTKKPGKSKRGPSKMSDAHKEALAVGRNQGRAVRNYLEALAAHKPKRGRKRTPENVEKRIAAIDAELANGVDPLKRVHLVQERIDLTAELGQLRETVDLAPIEDAFVEVALPYSEAKGLSFAAWREAGVPADVLRRAGLK